MVDNAQQRNLEDIPADALAQLKFVWMEQIDEANQAQSHPEPARR